jgi:hypothetical protein
LQRDEPAAVIAPAIGETAPMAVSKRAASASDDKKANMLKKLMPWEEKSIQAAKRRGRHTNLKLKQKQKQQATDEAMRVVATMLAFQMQANANAHVRFAYHGRGHALHQEREGHRQCSSSSAGLVGKLGKFPGTASNFRV